MVLGHISASLLISSAQYILVAIYSYFTYYDKKVSKTHQVSDEAEQETVQANEAQGGDLLGHFVELSWA